MCPRSNVRYCPLYHAAHMVGGDDLTRFGCDDGRLDEGGCAVDRGRDYSAAVADLAVAAPRLVATLRFNEEAATAAEQRQRNLRARNFH